MRLTKPIAALVFFVVAIDTSHGCWWGPSYYGPPIAYYYAPPMMVYPPVYYQPMYVVPMAPTFNVPYPPPRVVPNAPPETMPKRQVPPKSNSAAPAEVPFSEIKPATFSTPLEEQPESKVPMLELPMPKAETPKVELPKVEPSKAVPMPESPKIEFKAPKVDETPRIDPPKVELPKAETPKLELPPLALPSAPKLELPPLNMTPIPAPMPEKSTSKFRAEPQFDIKAMTMTSDTANDRHTIAFKNTTDRDVTLFVHGQSMTLAAKHQVTATVPTSFRWKLGNEATTDVKVPAGVAAYEVTIK